jgi:hypothetical protein
MSGSRIEDHAVHIDPEIENKFNRLDNPEILH